MINPYQTPNIIMEIENLKNKNLSLENDIKSYESESQNQPSLPPPIFEDLIGDLDRRVIYDPLTEPSRRPPRHVIEPVLGSPYFNYPTRGFADSYALHGYLVKDNHKMNNEEDIKDIKNKEENMILKLFGREKYPNSTEYEYYVMINTGYNDSIKYFLENQRKELYDGDSVYIDIIKAKYRVKILKNRTFEYNPYLI